MSDIRAGWVELVVAPLGPETPAEIPLYALPCLFPLLDNVGLRTSARAAGEGP